MKKLLAVLVLTLSLAAYSVPVALAAESPYDTSTSTATQDSPAAPRAWISLEIHGHVTFSAGTPLPFINIGDSTNVIKTVQIACD